MRQPALESIPQTHVTWGLTNPRTYQICTSKDGTKLPKAPNRYRECVRNSTKAEFRSSAACMGKISRHRSERVANKKPPIDQRRFSYSHITSFSSRLAAKGEWAMGAVPKRTWSASLTECWAAESVSRTIRSVSRSGSEVPKC